VLAPAAVPPPSALANISQPSVVTSKVSSSLMKPRRGWGIVVSTESTIPASRWPQAVKRWHHHPYRSSVDLRAPSDFFVLKTISRQQNDTGTLA
jgi:hypothetical protein